MGVALGFGELHGIHALTGVPVEEGTTLVHRRELVQRALEELLHGGGVREACRSLRVSDGRDGAEGYRYIVGDPLNELGRVLSLKVQDRLLMMDLSACKMNSELGSSHLGFLRSDFATEDGRSSEVATLSCMSNATVTFA